jgi:plasmid stabilization system protein ParE
MATLTIRWTRQAIADVDHIYDFIAANNAAAARAMVDRIDRAINSLGAHPPDRASRSRGGIKRADRFRHTVHAYRLRGRAVELLGIIHAARRWPDRL